jgi:hypothetical protein
LALAEVACPWNVEPGWSLRIILFFPALHLCTGCGAGVILHGKISLAISKWL